MKDFKSFSNPSFTAEALDEGSEGDAVWSVTEGGNFVEHLEREGSATGRTVAIEDDVKGGEVGIQAGLPRRVVEGEGGFELAGFREGGEDGV